MDLLTLSILFGAHAFCSVSMVLMNKTLIAEFDYAFTIVFLQNLGSVLLAYCFPFVERLLRGSEDAGHCKREGQFPSFGKQRRLFGMRMPGTVKNRLLVVVLMALLVNLLFTSFKALKFTSVPLYVVARNCVPAQTAVFEWFWNGTKVRSRGVAGLALTILGAVVFAHADASQSELDGLSWAILLSASVSVSSVADKNIVRTLIAEEGLTPVEINQQRVFLTLPVAALIAANLEMGVWDERVPVVLAAQSMSSKAVVSLFVTCVCAFGIGSLVFSLQQATTAASVQVANIGYKLVTTILSRVTHPSPVPQLSWVGFAFSILGIALYTISGNSPAPVKDGDDGGNPD